MTLELSLALGYRQAGGNHRRDSGEVMKIVIKQSETADSRTCDFSKVTERQLYDSSVQHIGDVKQAMNLFADMAVQAGERHDWTKIDQNWFPLFYQQFTSDSFMNDEGIIEGTWYYNHVHKERHHLDTHVPDNINLIDVLERISDCVMAGMGRSGRVDWEYGGTPLINAEVLLKAAQNTFNLLADAVVVD